MAPEPKSAALSAGSKPPPGEITRKLAAYAVHSSFAALPGRVFAEAQRAFLNWMGCVFGGCGEPAVGIAVAAVGETGGRPEASIIGYKERTDLASAAFVNCVSSSALAFDDTHPATVTHPTGPVAAALFALSEKVAVPGEEFVNALALGIEIECRIGNVLLLPPARANLGLYVTGLTGPIGAAAALGRLLNFDDRQMNWAIGLAATQASGFRATHGSMAGLAVPGLGARNGVAAALLAAKGFTCSEHALEAGNGFIEIFASGGNLDRAVDGLGRHFELLANAYKPYPCGIVIHPTIDACLEISERLEPNAAIADVAAKVHPLALTLTGRRAPTTPLEAQVSLFHWMAAALLRGRAGLAEMRQDCIDDPAVAALRERITAVPDPHIGRDEAVVGVTLCNDAVLRSHIANARGSIARPMTDDELSAKFQAQVSTLLPSHATDALLRLCREVSALRDVGKEIATVVNT
jgi:2-methylcitrate dehydratase PrpD